MVSERGNKVLEGTTSYTVGFRIESTVSEKDKICERDQKELRAPAQSKNHLFFIDSIV